MSQEPKTALAPRLPPGVKPKAQLPREVDSDKLYELLVYLVERLDFLEDILDTQEKRIRGLEFGRYVRDDEPEDGAH